MNCAISINFNDFEAHFTLQKVLAEAHLANTHHQQQQQHGRDGETLPDEQGVGHDLHDSACIQWTFVHAAPCMSGYVQRVCALLCTGTRFPRHHARRAFSARYMTAVSDMDRLRFVNSHRRLTSGFKIIQIGKVRRACICDRRRDRKQ